MDFVPHTIDNLGIKVKRIKLIPSQSQKQTLLEWFGIYRYIYNQGLSILKDGIYEKGKSILSQLRDRVVKKKNYVNENTWVNKLPADTRDYAIKELVQAFKNGLRKKKLDGKPFELGFKSKRQSQSIEFRRDRQYHSKSGNYHFLSEIKTTEVVPEMKHDVKIQRDRIGDFYLIIPMDVVRNESQVPHRIIAIDPGIRTVMTGYSPDGFLYQLGYHDISRLARLLHARHRLQGRVATHGRHNKNRIRRAFRKAGIRIDNLVSECHKKIVHWLFDNFDCIIIPKLDTNGLCRKRLSRQVKNKIRVWKHCSLIERIKNKCREYPETQVIIPTEEYTSKTCSSCGCLNEYLGSSEVFKCPSCHEEFDRDVNGAFNILLKVLTEIYESLDDSYKEVLDLV